MNVKMSVHIQTTIYCKHPRVNEEKMQVGIECEKKIVHLFYKASYTRKYFILEQHLESWSYQFDFIYLYTYLPMYDCM